MSQQQTANAAPSEAVQRSLNAFTRLVGPRYGQCDFDSYLVNNEKQSAIVDSVRGFADDLPARVKAGENLILFGPPGTGKDHLLCSVAKAGIRRGLNVVSPTTRLSRPNAITWTSGPMLSQQFRDAMLGEADTAALFKSMVLVISDPTLDGQMSDFQARELYAVIDHRYRHQLPTWVTCNIESRDEFDQRLTRQIADRLRHDATALFCDWPSYRTVRSP